MKLTDNDWIFLNDLIFKIHSIPDLDQMRYTFLELVKLLIPCETLTFFLADPCQYMRSPIVIGAEKSYIDAYLGDLGKIDYKRWIFLSSQNKAYRETDLLPNDLREQEPYYQKAYQPINIHYGAILSLAYQSQFVGVVSLYRPSNGEDFSDRDMFVLEMIKNHLAFRLYRELFENAPSSCKTSLRQLEEQIRTLGLTPREIEICSLLLEGESNSAISQNLFISASTLRKHISNIYAKLNISSRAELFRRFLR